MGSMSGVYGVAQVIEQHDGKLTVIIPGRKIALGQRNGTIGQVNFPDDRTHSFNFDGNTIKWSNNTQWTKSAKLAQDHSKAERAQLLKDATAETSMSGVYGDAQVIEQHDGKLTVIMPGRKIALGQRNGTIGQVTFPDEITHFFNFDGNIGKTHSFNFDGNTIKWSNNTQ